MRLCEKRLLWVLLLPVSSNWFCKPLAPHAGTPEECVWALNVGKLEEGTMAPNAGTLEHNLAPNGGIADEALSAGANAGRFSPKTGGLPNEAFACANFLDPSQGDRVVAGVDAEASAGEGTAVAGLPGSGLMGTGIVGAYCGERCRSEAG